MSGDCCEDLTTKRRYNKREYTSRVISYCDYYRAQKPSMKYIIFLRLPEGGREEIRITLSSYRIINAYHRGDETEGEGKKYTKSAVTR